MMALQFFRSVGNPFRRLAFKAASTVARMLSIENTDGWYASGMGDAGEPVTDSSVLSISSAWACINLLSGTIASLPLMVFRYRLPTSKKRCASIALTMMI